MFNLNCYFQQPLHLSSHCITIGRMVLLLYFVVITFFVVVCFPPSVDLLGLLKWRSNTSLLQQNLRQLMKVEGGEVVKVRGRTSLIFIKHPRLIAALKSYLILYDLKG